MGEISKDILKKFNDNRHTIEKNIWKNSYHDFHIGGKGYNSAIFLLECTCCIPNTSFLLAGGVGRGKTDLMNVIGHILTGDEIPIIHCNQETTTEKIKGTLDLPTFENKGKIKINWSKWLEAPVKGLDEITRMPPGKMEIVQSLLAEGKVEYLGDVYELDKMTLMASYNPNEIYAATYPFPLNIKDRFAACAIVQIHTPIDTILLTEKKSRRLDPEAVKKYKKDLLRIEKDEKEELKKILEDIKLNKDARLYVAALINGLTFCERSMGLDKGSSEILPPEICGPKECRFYHCICSKFREPVTSRIKDDLISYSKAASFLIEKNEVNVDILKAMSPFVLFHRLTPVRDEFSGYPYYGNDRIHYIRTRLDDIRLYEVKEVWNVIENVINKHERVTGEIISLEDFLKEKKLIKEAVEKLEPDKITIKDSDLIERLDWDKEFFKEMPEAEKQDLRELHSSKYQFPFARKLEKVLKSILGEKEQDES